MRKIPEGWFATLAIVGSVVVAVASCSHDFSPTLMGERGLRADSLHVRRYMDLCWPPSDQCKERSLTQTEYTKSYQLAENINTQADSRCATIKNQAIEDLIYGQFRMWYQGPPDYDPTTNYFGDRHNAVAISHITPLSYGNNMELMKTIIHESAHAIGVTDDGTATQLEEACLGNYDVP
jgi:hypothetical protein